MGIFTPHSSEELQTWSSSAEVSFPGIPRESQDLFYLLSNHLCKEDKKIREIHSTISVIYFLHKAISSQSLGGCQEPCIWPALS